MAYGILKFSGTFILHTGIYRVSTTVCIMMSQLCTTISLPDASSTTDKTRYKQYCTNIQMYLYIYLTF